MLLDTSIIIEIFLLEKNTDKFREIYNIIKEETTFISLIQIGEISDWCLKNRINPLEVLAILKDLVNIIPLNEKILLNGSKIKFNMRNTGIKKFSLIDGIILASAREYYEKLLTYDSDFKNAENTIVLSKDR